MFAELSLAQPLWLAGIPLAWALLAWRRDRVALGRPGAAWVRVHPLADAMHGAARQRRAWWLYALAFSAFFLALARPQTPGAWIQPEPEARQIVMLVDVSPSMSLTDPGTGGSDRMTILKRAAAEFIDLRGRDQFGLIAFAEHAATLAPRTADHAVLRAMIDRLDPGLLGRGTAIGDALGLALRQIGAREGEPPLLVLFTDGTNTAGRLDPGESILLAEDLGVRIYTVAVGRDVAEAENLAEAAARTGGQHYTATGGEELAEVTRRIDRLERTAVPPPSERRTREWYAPPLLVGLLLLALGWWREPAA